MRNGETDAVCALRRGRARRDRVCRAALAARRASARGRRRGRSPAIKAADVAKLELTNDKNEKTVLEKSGAEWRVKSPGDWKADQQSVKQVVDGLAKLTFADVASENADKQAELGVADGKGARVVAKDASGKTLADLHVGKPVGGFTMMRVDGKKETWQASGAVPVHHRQGPVGLARPRHLRARPPPTSTSSRSRRRAASWCCQGGGGRQGQARPTPSGRSTRPRATRPRRRPTST